VDAGVVDSDVWYMSIDSTADAVRFDIVQTDQTSALQSVNSHEADFAAVQTSTGQLMRWPCLCLRAFSLM